MGHRDNQLYHLLKRVSFLYWITFTPLVKIIFPYMCRSVSGPIYSVLCICWTPVPYCLDCYSFISHEIGYSIPNLFTFLNVVFTILSPLHFCTNFRTRKFFLNYCFYFWFCFVALVFFFSYLFVCLRFFWYWAFSFRFLHFIF